VTEAWRDRARLRRLARGDVSALEEIYDLHANRLFGLALFLTRRREDAEEVVQTVMVKLASRGQELLAIREPASCMVTMARREALDCLTARAARPEDAIDEEGLFEGSLEVDAQAGTIRVAALAPADAIALKTAIAELPSEQREVVYLHAYEGWSFREIGEALVVPTFTAASRYRLALERLRERLVGQGGLLR
jgi:RNA polymerase sigma-70 factor (ECF subfamily)